MYADLEATVEMFQNDLREVDMNYLRGRGLSDDTIQDARLGYVKEGPYQDAIAIPYLNPYDKSVRTIRFRFLNPTGQKYHSMRGSNVHLFNVIATTKPRVWLCEGEFDCLILNQMGYDACGISGVSAFKTDWKYLFSSADQVNLVFDADEAGQKAARKVASIIGPVAEDCRIILLPEGQDVTDYNLRSPEGLRELLD